MYYIFIIYRNTYRFYFSHSTCALGQKKPLFYILKLFPSTWLDLAHAAEFLTQYYSVDYESDYILCHFQESLKGKVMYKLGAMFSEDQKKNSQLNLQKLLHTCLKTGKKIDGSHTDFQKFPQLRHYTFNFGILHLSME